MHIMRDVLIALAPATVMAVVLFRLSALLVLLTCVGGCVLSEYVFTKLTRRPTTIADLSAVVTGVLLALNVGPKTPLWQCAVGSVFAIVVVKCFFGGLGHNFANPAVTGRVMMLLAFASSMTEFVTPSFTSADLVSGATPLVQLKAEQYDALPELWQMLVGLRGGSLGEVCSLALLLGGVYLVARRVIRWQVPVTFIATVFLLSWLICGDAYIALYYILSGGLLLGAIFMATDYVTTPLTFWGKVLFAFGCGVITVLIRFFGAYPEGVSFAILIMNIVSPYLEKWTTPKAFGGKDA